MQSNPFRLVLPAAVLVCAPLASANAAGDYEAEAQKLYGYAMGATECAPTAEHECNAVCEDAYSASKKLGALLTKAPAAFTAVAPMFKATFDEGGNGRNQVLGFLASCGTDHCVALGEELFAASPKAFTEGQLLSFAEAGSEGLTKELQALVKAGKTESTLPAAWFALRGDAVGKKSLKRALSAAAIDADNVVEVLVSGAALTALGEEKALPHARSRVHAAVLAALDAGQLESARAMALAAEALEKPLGKAVEANAKGYQGKSKIRVSGLSEELGWHMKKSGEKLATADAVFELIERITPLS